MKNFFIWLGKFVHDGRTGNPSVKRLGLAMAITVLCGVMAGLGFVMSYTVFVSTGSTAIETMRIAAGSLEIVTGLVLTSVTSSYLVDKAINKKGANDGEQS